MDDTNNPLVAPDRCMWLVTVDGPFQSVSSLTGAKEPAATSYTVLIDSASGDVLDLLAGPGAPSLTSGAGLGSS